MNGKIILWKAFFFFKTILWKDISQFKGHWKPNQTHADTSSWNVPRGQPITLGCVHEKLLLHTTKSMHRERGTDNGCQKRTVWVCGRFMVVWLPLLLEKLVWGSCMFSLPMFNEYAIAISPVWLCFYATVALCYWGNHRKMKWMLQLASATLFLLTMTRC